MKENFLHHIWKYKLFPQSNIFTVDGKRVEIVSSGMHNTNAGPDFTMAKIKIDGTLWAGNVEIHIHTSDWNRHQHHLDKAYDNVILHIVYKHDQPIDNKTPTLELKSLIPQKLITNFQSFQAPYQFIPCEKNLKMVDETITHIWLETLYINRLQQKSERIYQDLNSNKGNWEAVLFKALAMSFGLKINTTAFEVLANSFPFEWMGKVRQYENGVEALLMGQAGFLENAEDNYTLELKNRYQFFQRKFGLQPMDNAAFKFLRLRPPNFPTVRLAQLSALYQKYPKILSSVLSFESYKEWEDWMTQVWAGVYWDNHFRFNQESTQNYTKKLSKSFLQILFVNAVLPVCFAYEKNNRNSEELKMVDWLRRLKPEKNKIIFEFEKYGATISNAFESQSYLELKKNFCDTKKCLNCRMGHYLLKNV